MQSTTSIKAQFNGQYRRFTLQSNSFDALAETIRTMFNISEALEVRVRYLDDEGDEITVSSDAELASAVQMSSGCLKISVVALQKETKQINSTVPTSVVIISEAKEPQAEPATKPRNQMPDFVREIIKQKQANKKEKPIKAAKPQKLDEKPNRSAHRARLVTALDAPDCEEFAPDVLFTKSWKLRNVGALPWSTEFKLIRVQKDTGGMSQVDTVPITHEVAPNEKYEVSVPMRAPNQPGTYECFWRMADNEGKKFGPRLICKINVVAEQPEKSSDEETVDLSTSNVSVDRKQLALARKQERMNKYEAQITELRKLGYKPNNQHLRLLAEYDGDVNRVVAFIAQKKAQAKS